MIPERVSGQKDPRIRLLRELLVEEGRKRQGMFFAEGREIVARAFDYGAQVAFVVLADRFVASPDSQQILGRADRAGVPVLLATEGLLGKTLETKPTPECIAVVARKTHSLKEVLSGCRQLLLMVEQGENADNLGMLLRSCDAAGVTGVILAAGTTDPFARRVVRGSRGSVFSLPICITGSAAQVVDRAKENAVQVIASSANADLPYTAPDYRAPTVFVVGNEHTGISEEIRRRASKVVSIPMLGKVNSLNIAVAASVLLYEAVRQRGQRSMDSPQ